MALEEVLELVEQYSKIGWGFKFSDNTVKYLIGDEYQKLHDSLYNFQKVNDRANIEELLYGNTNYSLDRVDKMVKEYIDHYRVLPKRNGETFSFLIDRAILPVDTNIDLENVDLDGLVSSLMTDVNSKISYYQNQHDNPGSNNIVQQLTEIQNALQRYKPHTY